MEHVSHHTKFQPIIRLINAHIKDNNAAVVETQIQLQSNALLGLEEDTLCLGVVSGVG
jgi:hypothetical protein